MRDPDYEKLNRELRMDELKGQIREVFGKLETASERQEVGMETIRFIVEDTPLRIEKTDALIELLRSLLRKLEGDLPL